MPKMPSPSSQPPKQGNGAAKPGTASGGTADAPKSIFTEATPDGAAKKVSEVLGEIVWLMSQSPLHKQFFIQDLEWPVGEGRHLEHVMTPILLQQFRIYYAQDRPVGVVLWAKVDDEVEERLKSGATKLRPQDWKSGTKPHVVEVIAPFGGADEMVRELNGSVFPNCEVKMVKVGG